ncbi:/ rpsQ / 30S ribosomal protein S17 /:431927 Reverse [Candidatus Hepatoplasma crinochetorum]|uniref:Small ribosomal subunit protein uS17 n=1 Tax=Candidatus Hepatoplasma crinochetorum TaxID=295596 RepID=A0A0G7ZMV6_9MOLU|nr:/ rpsQ / 30S ribosomal protein S17 /:431927 Reverse [Candidatus Hepatoplasma crinochetorum]
MRTNRRKNYQGIVVSTAMDKTITVQVDTYRAHKLYGKRYRYSKKFHVHDQNNEAKIGDKVLIMETKPYSKTKYFRLVKIVEKKDGK